MAGVAQKKRKTMAGGVVSRLGEIRLDEIIYGNFESSVVRLHPPAPGKTGNGFIVYSNGTLLIMSCEHIMRELPLGSRMPAYFYDKSNATVMLLHVDKDRDLSLLKIVDSQRVCSNPVQFLDVNTVPGMDVVMLSFFKMDGSHVVRPGTFQGKIVGPPDARRGPPIAKAPEHECVRSNYVARPGISGAPVFSASRLLVGVQVCHALGFTYAVSVPTIKDALRGWLQLSNENASIPIMLMRLASQADTHEGLIYFSFGVILPARDVVSYSEGHDHDHDRQLFWENDTCLVAGWLSRVCVFVSVMCGTNRCMPKLVGWVSIYMSSGLS